MKTARNLVSQSKYFDAIQEYIKALFLDKNNSEAYKELAAIYL